MRWDIQWVRFLGALAAIVTIACAQWGWGGAWSLLGLQLVLWALLFWYAKHRIQGLRGARPSRVEGALAVRAMALLKVFAPLALVALGFAGLAAGNWLDQYLPPAKECQKWNSLCEAYNLSTGVLAHAMLAFIVLGWVAFFLKLLRAFAGTQVAEFASSWLAEASKGKGTLEKLPAILLTVGALGTATVHHNEDVRKLMGLPPAGKPADEGPKRKGNDDTMPGLTEAIQAFNTGTAPQDLHELAVQLSPKGGLFELVNTMSKDITATRSDMSVPKDDIGSLALRAQLGTEAGIYAKAKQAVWGSVVVATPHLCEFTRVANRAACRKCFAGNGHHVFSVEGDSAYCDAKSMP
jgi:hypothetical protein